MPQEPAPADELFTLRYPKSKSSPWVVRHGCVTCSNPFPAQPRFALLCSPALCCCIYWAFLEDKIELIFRPLWVLFKNWLLLSGSGLCCSVSHLDCSTGYLFFVNHMNDLKLNRRKPNQLKSNHSSSCYSSWAFKNTPILDKSHTDLFWRWIFCRLYFCWLWKSFFPNRMTRREHSVLVWGLFFSLWNLGGL